MLNMFFSCLNFYFHWNFEALWIFFNITLKFVDLIWLQKHVRQLIRFYKFYENMIFNCLLWQNSHAKNRNERRHSQSVRKSKQLGKIWLEQGNNNTNQTVCRRHHHHHPPSTLLFAWGKFKIFCKFFLPLSLWSWPVLLNAVDLFVFPNNFPFLICFGLVWP